MYSIYVEIKLSVVLTCLYFTLQYFHDAMDDFYNSCRSAKN